MTETSNIDRVTALLASSVTLERQQGIVMAVRGGLTSLISRITEIAGSDTDEETRFLARKALERLVKSSDAAVDRQEFAQLTVEQLLALEDPHARVAGLKKLIAEPNHTGRLLLINALKVETVLQLKASMIIALGKFANPEDIPVLVPYLRHEDARIRANTVEALAFFGNEEAYRFIIASMSDEDNRVKANVVKALQSIGGQSLFDLLQKMAQDEKLWTRASAAYAFYRIKSPQSLVALARIAHSDAAPDLRRKALEYIQAEKNEGNPAAAIVLEKLEQSQTREELTDTLSEVDDASVAETDIAELLTSEDAARRYAALCRINSEGVAGHSEDLLAAFAREEDSFLLSMMLTMVRENKLAGGFELSSRCLNHADERVRANAVEAVAATMPAGASLDCLVPLLKDSYSRVVANALLALHQCNRVDLVAELKNMMACGREAFKRSALYVVGQVREPILVPMLEKLLHDHNPRVRDTAYKILQKYADARVNGAVSLLQHIKKQIELERSRDRFFENRLDQVFAGLLRLLRSVGGDKTSEADKSLFKRNPEAEKQALLMLAQKCLQHKIVDEKTLKSLQAIDTELEHIQELLKKSQAQEEKNSVSEETRRQSEQELLKIEQQSLKHRREAILNFLAFEVYSNRSHLDARTSALLLAEFGRVEANLCSYIPEHTFSMLPEESAPVSEFFDVAMRLYQKHVAAFSLYTLWQLLRWCGTSFLFVVIFFLAAWINKNLAILTLLGIVPYMAYKTLGIIVEWKINIALMVDDGIHGREHDRERAHDKADELYTAVFASSLKKHFYLVLWFILAAILSGTILAAGKVTRFSTLASDLANLSAMLMMLAVFASAYFKYLLVEPSAILTPKRDAFETAETVFTHNRVKLATLFIFSTFIIQLVTGTSVEIVNQISSTLPGFIGDVLVIALSFISDMCLAPIVFSTLCIYSLVHLKKGISKS